MEDYQIPYHVAIIMDGNGRWAKEKGKIRSYGHEMGAKTLKELALYAFSKGVKILSVFAFSTENFKRSEEEVGFLMNLFIKLFNTEFKIFNEKDIKVVFSKKESGLPPKVEEAIKKIVKEKSYLRLPTYAECLAKLKVAIYVGESSNDFFLDMLQSEGLISEEEMRQRYELGADPEKSSIRKTIKIQQEEKAEETRKNKNSGEGR